MINPNHFDTKQFQIGTYALPPKKKISILNTQNPVNKTFLLLFFKILRGFFIICWIRKDT